MSIDKIDAAVADHVAEAVKSETELVEAISETANDRVESAEKMAADVIAAAETTALGVKIASIEERLNTWPSSSGEDFAALKMQHQQILAMLETMNTKITELLDLLTEMEETEEVESSIPPITPAEATTNSPLPDAKSESSAPEKPKSNKVRLL
jgi:hypothetical protein